MENEIIFSRLQSLEAEVGRVKETLAENSRAIDSQTRSKAIYEEIRKVRDSFSSDIR